MGYRVSLQVAERLQAFFIGCNFPYLYDESQDVAGAYQAIAVDAR